MIKIAYTKIKIGKKRHSILIYILAVILVTASWDMINKLFGFNVLVSISDFVDKIYSTEGTELLGDFAFTWFKASSMKITILNTLFYGVAYMLYKLILVQLYVWFRLKRIEKTFWTIWLRCAINIAYTLLLTTLVVILIEPEGISQQLGLVAVFLSIKLVDEIQKTHMYDCSIINVAEECKIK